MNSLINRNLLVLTLIVGVVVRLFGVSYYFPKFGTPVVTEKHLVFSGPSWESHRIICVLRENGRKAWEIEDKQVVLDPCFAMDGRIIATKGADVYSISLENGEDKLLYSTGYERSWLRSYNLPFTIISGEKEGVVFLSLVDLRRASKRWEVSNLIDIVAHDNDILLCEYAEREVRESEGYTNINRKLLAVSASTGKTLWAYHQPRECYHVTGVAVDKHFVINLAGAIHCINQKTGVAVKKLQVQRSPYASVSLAEHNGVVLAWIQDDCDVFSGYTIYSLSVPSLTKTELTKTDWYSAEFQTYGDIVVGRTIGRVDTYNIMTGEKLWQGGQWSWDGIHDGLIYYSTMEDNGNYTSVNKIDVVTGRCEKLYEEPLPQESQLKQIETTLPIDKEIDVKAFIDPDF
ncbi:MAG: hypothetical protein PHO37_16065 [Kiritimatiellae bacterium]|nr:hypothetical protein [Kiritimatiellia bacterium]